MPPPPRATARLGISYRVATDDDLPFVAMVYASTRLEELAMVDWTDEVRGQFLAHQHDAQHRHYRAHYPEAEWLVVERGGEPVGRLYIEEWSREYRIIDISLLPEHRGSGTGSAILNDILDQARAAGKGVSIHVERNNPAMRLYVRLGFVKIDEHGVYDLMDWRPQESASS